MIAVGFKHSPAPGQQTIYFELAAHLRPELNAINGFINIKSFESLATLGLYLLLSWLRGCLQPSEKGVQLTNMSACGSPPWASRRPSKPLFG